VVRMTALIQAGDHPLCAVRVLHVVAALEHRLLVT
jgi:hypothetical protein